MFALKKIKPEALIIILSLFFSSYSKAQTDQEVKMQIDSLVAVYMKTYRITRLAVGIVKNGIPYFAKGYGYTTIEKKFPVTEKTAFYTASITKLFTTAAIMQWVEKGELKLSDKVIEHLPDFKMKDGRYKEITIEHLLTHSSGLPWEHSFKNSPDDSTALEKFILSLKKEKLQFNPGEKFDGTTYSNVGYSILGLIVQRKSGLQFDDYIEKFVFEPVGITNCTFAQENIDAKIKAMPHILSGNTNEVKRFNLYGVIKDENPVLKYPAKPIVIYETYGKDKEHDPNRGLIASAVDLTQWMVHHLKIYVDSLNLFSGIIQHNTLKDIWSLKKTISGYQTSFGIGWWRFNGHEYGDYMFHVGRETGFSSTLMIFPAEKLGITILSNGMYADQVVWNILPFEIIKFCQ